MKSLPKGLEGRILEVRCGARLTFFSRELEVYGANITPEMIKLFKISYSKEHVIIGDIKMLPFKEESFDIIVSTSLLHHVENSRAR